MRTDIPAPKFARFERVRVVGEKGHNGREFNGERGTVIWHDSYVIWPARFRDAEWLYIVHLPDRHCWRTFVESDLESEGAFDSEVAHLAQHPEITFDTILDEDNEWVEGCYRLPGHFWQVVIFQKADVAEIEHQTQVWERPTEWEVNATGIVVRFPRARRVDRDCLLQTMFLIFGCGPWREVRGPDSMSLR